MNDLARALPLPEYRLILVCPRFGTILLTRSPEGLKLPSVAVPLFVRTAEHLTAEVLRSFDIRAIVIDWFPAAIEGAETVVAMEVDTENVGPEANTLVSTRLEGYSIQIIPSLLRDTVTQMMEGNTGNRGPFSRFGWLDDAKAWIQESAKHRSFRFVSVQQFNAGATFALLHLSTSSAPSYWLKAVGVPNTREFGITEYLRRTCPRFLPRVVAMRHDWCCWIMEDFGLSLHNSSSLAEFELAARKLAELQCFLTGRVDDLMLAGCADNRLPVLAGQIDEIIEYLQEAMKRQTSTTVLPVSSTRLTEIGRLLHEACDAMQALQIPDSLMHNDISPGSILTNNVDCVFTDWCEGYVGNPFITFEQFRVHVSQKSVDVDRWLSAIDGAYAAVWRNSLTDGQIRRGMVLAEFLSVFAYLCGRGDWIQSPRKAEADILRYSRGLGRHLDKAAAKPALLEALCQLN